MSWVKMRMINEATKNRALRSSDHFLPMIAGSGAKRIGPTSPPIGNMLPIHESCSEVGTKSSGESVLLFVIFAIAGEDQPIDVPHEIPTRFAIKIKQSSINALTNFIYKFTNNRCEILIELALTIPSSWAFHQRLRFSTIETEVEWYSIKSNCFKQSHVECWHFSLFTTSNSIAKLTKHKSQIGSKLFRKISNQPKTTNAKFVITQWNRREVECNKERYEKSRACVCGNENAPKCIFDLNLTLLLNLNLNPTRKFHFFYIRDVHVRATVLY